MKRKKLMNSILITTAGIVVVALAYSINLVYNQQQLLNSSIAALDRIILNVDRLEAERNRLVIENIKLRQLEEKTAEEMEEMEELD